MASRREAEKQDDFDGRCKRFLSWMEKNELFVKGVILLVAFLVGNGTSSESAQFFCLGVIAFFIVDVVFFMPVGVD